MTTPDYVEHTCGDCNNRLGEECGGMHEGIEVYEDTPACIDWDPVGDY